MLFMVKYDFSQKIGEKWNTYSGNLVGRQDGKPVGYGPVGPPDYFRADEVPGIIRVLTEQLGTVPIITLIPTHFED